MYNEENIIVNRSNINWQDLKSYKFQVHCSTKEIKKDFLESLLKNNITGSPLTFDNELEDSYYFVNKNLNNGRVYTSLHKEHNLTVVEWSIENKYEKVNSTNLNLLELRQCKFQIYCPSTEIFNKVSDIIANTNFDTSYRYDDWSEETGYIYYNNLNELLEISKERIDGRKVLEYNEGGDLMYKLDLKILGTTKTEVLLNLFDVLGKGNSYIEEKHIKEVKLEPIPRSIEQSGIKKQIVKEPVKKEIHPIDIIIKDSLFRIAGYDKTYKEKFLNLTNMMSLFVNRESISSNKLLKTAIILNALEEKEGLDLYKKIYNSVDLTRINKRNGVVLELNEETDVLIQPRFCTCCPTYIVKVTYKKENYVFNTYEFKDIIIILELISFAYSIFNEGVNLNPMIKWIVEESLKK